MPRSSAVVPGAADAESIAIPADHLNMVKFASREDGGYEKVSEHLWLLVEEAPNAISVRWAEQDKINRPNSNFANYGGNVSNQVGGNQNVHGNINY